MLLAIADASPLPLRERAFRGDLARDAKRRMRKSHGGKGEGCLHHPWTFAPPSLALPLKGGGNGAELTTEAHA